MFNHSFYLCFFVVFYLYDSFSFPLYSWSIDTFIRIKLRFWAHIDCSCSCVVRCKHIKFLFFIRWIFIKKRIFFQCFSLFYLKIQFSTCFLISSSHRVHIPIPILLCSCCDWSHDLRYFLCSIKPLTVWINTICK